MSWVGLCALSAFVRRLLELVPASLALVLPGLVFSQAPLVAFYTKQKKWRSVVQLEVLCSARRVVALQLCRRRACDVRARINGLGHLLNLKVHFTLQSKV